MSYLHLIIGTTREDTARALLEYRRYAKNNPSCELTPCLLSTARKIRLALQEQRQVERAIGWGDKPLARNKERTAHALPK